MEGKTRETKTIIKYKNNLRKTKWATSSFTFCYKIPVIDVNAANIFGTNLYE
jgi:hypothetical protein